MPEFITRKDTEHWLSTREPEEISLFAARAVLRVLPALEMDPREQMPAAWLLPVFRAMTKAWVLGKWPNLGRQVAYSFSYAPTYQSVGEHIVSFPGHAATVVVDVANKAARTSTEVAHIPSHSFSKQVAVRESDVAARASDDIAEAIAKVTPDNILRALKAASAAANAADKTAFEEGKNVPELAAMPLWPDGKTPEAMTTFWDKLKARLPEDEDWDVWTDWYEDRLRGAKADRELEKARVLIPDEDWERGPAHVNGIVKRSLEEVGRTGKVSELRVICGLVDSRGFFRWGLA